MVTNKLSFFYQTPFCNNEVSLSQAEDYSDLIKLMYLPHAFSLVKHASSWAALAGGAKKCQFSFPQPLQLSAYSRQSVYTHGCSLLSLAHVHALRDKEAMQSSQLEYTYSTVYACTMNARTSALVDRATRVENFLTAALFLPGSWPLSQWISFLLLLAENLSVSQSSPSFFPSFLLLLSSFPHDLTKDASGQVAFEQQVELVYLVFVARLRE